jgi:hypothetical protein
VYPAGNSRAKSTRLRQMRLAPLRPPCRSCRPAKTATAMVVRSKLLFTPLRRSHHSRDLTSALNLPTETGKRLFLLLADLVVTAQSRGEETFMAQRTANCSSLHLRTKWGRQAIPLNPNAPARTRTALGAKRRQGTRASAITATPNATIIQDMVRMVCTYFGP